MRKSANHFPIILLTISSCFIITCQKEAVNERDFPRFVNIDVTKVDGEGATFFAELFYQTKGTMLDHGFYWSQQNNYNTTTSHHISLGSKNLVESFSVDIASGLEKGKVYYVFAYANVADKQIFSPIIAFNSQGSLKPEVLEILPNNGTVGDTILIKGKNFGFSNGDAKVYFNEQQAEIVALNDEQMSVIVPRPDGSDEANVTIVSGGMTHTRQQGFFYLKPVISAIYPERGLREDTITIKGIRFGTEYDLCKVFFGSQPASLVSFSDTLVKVAAPTSTGSPSRNVSIEIDKLKSAENVVFTYEQPIINQIDPQSGVLGDLVTIRGKFFGYKSVYFRLLLEGQPLSFIQHSDTLVRFYVPPSGGYGQKTLVVEYDNLANSGSHSFIYSVPVIHDFTPKSGGIGTIVTITGENFDNLPTNNAVYFGPYTRGKITSASTNQLIVEIPPEYSAGMHEITVVTTDDMTGKSSQKFEVLGPWRRVSDFPGTERVFAASFSVGSYGYLGLGYDGDWPKDLYRYNPANDSWNGMTNFNSDFHVDFSGSINGKGFMLGRGHMISGLPYELISFNPATNSYEYMEPFPYEPGISSGTAFIVNNKIYAIEHDWNPFHEYNPLEDTWEEKGIFPGSRRGGAVAFSLNGKGYVGSGATGGNQYLDDFWRYDPVTNSWEKIADFPVKLMHMVSFVIDEKVYVMAGSNWELGVRSRDIWTYNPGSNTWSKIGEFPGAARWYGACAFVIGNKAYFGMGDSYVDHYTIFMNDLWEFDPSKL